MEAGFHDILLFFCRPIILFLSTWPCRPPFLLQATITPAFPPIRRRCGRTGVFPNGLNRQRQVWQMFCQLIMRNKRLRDAAMVHERVAGREKDRLRTWNKLVFHYFPSSKTGELTAKLGFAIWRFMLHLLYCLFILVHNEHGRVDCTQTAAWTSGQWLSWRKPRRQAPF